MAAAQPATVEKRYVGEDGPYNRAEFVEWYAPEEVETRWSEAVPEDADVVAAAQQTLDEALENQTVVAKDAADVLRPPSRHRGLPASEYSSRELQVAAAEITAVAVELEAELEEELAKHKETIEELSEQLERAQHIAQKEIAAKSAYVWWRIRLEEDTSGGG